MGASRPKRPGAAQPTVRTTKSKTPERDAQLAAATSRTLQISGGADGRAEGEVGAAGSPAAAAPAAAEAPAAMEEDAAEEEASSDDDKEARIVCLEHSLHAVMHILTRMEDQQAKIMLKIELNMSKHDTLKLGHKWLEDQRAKIRDVAGITNISTDKKCMILTLKEDTQRMEIKGELEGFLDTSKCFVAVFQPPGKQTLTHFAKFAQNRFFAFTKSTGLEKNLSAYNMFYPQSLEKPEFAIRAGGTVLVLGRLAADMNSIEIVTPRRSVLDGKDWCGKSFIAHSLEELRGFKHYPWPFTSWLTSHVLDVPAHLIPKDKPK